jgi:CO dehydrogenase maturation factor
MAKITLPGRGSRLLRAAPGAGAGRGRQPGVGLAASGSFSIDDMGVVSYRAKTGAVELYFNHLLDGAASTW